MTTDPAPSASPASALQVSRTTVDAAVTRVRAFSVAAHGGQVTIDPATGAKLRQDLQAHAEQARSWVDRSTQLASGVPLGANPVGTAMSAKFAARASGSDDSLTNVLKQYVDALDQAQDALREAMARYAAAEQKAQDALRAAGHGLPTP